MSLLKLNRSITTTTTKIHSKITFFLIGTGREIRDKIEKNSFLLNFWHHHHQSFGFDSKMIFQSINRLWLNYQSMNGMIMDLFAANQLIIMNRLWWWLNHCIVINELKWIEWMLFKGNKWWQLNYFILGWRKKSGKFSIILSPSNSID